MKIIQVISDIKLESSGPTYYILGLCRSLSKVNPDLELHMLKSNYRGKESFQIKEYKEHKFPHPSMGRSSEMKRGLISACRNAEILHTNSLWMMPNIYPAEAVRNTTCKLVVSPHGTLATWALARHKYLKKVIGHFLGQYKVLQNAAMFHATCEKEYKEIRNAGYTQPVAILPIGIDIPEIERTIPQRRKLLFLGRIHPVKGIDRLLHAWNIVASKFPDWDFQIVGPDCGAKKLLQDQIIKQHIPRVYFFDEQNGLDKFKFYAQADLYALPSFTENFGVTVAEALSTGTPVIVSNTIPWAKVIDNGCGWMVGNSPGELAKQLNQCFGMNRDSLIKMGQFGKRWMQKDYSWDGIAPKMLTAYKWLLYGGDKPDFIVTE